MIRIKKFALYFCIVTAAGICSCNNQKDRDNRFIMEHYTGDMRYTGSFPLFFIPAPIHNEFLSIYRSFDPGAEYDDALLENFSAGYIRSNIYALYNAWFRSGKIECIIQFPDRAIYDEYISRLKENPVTGKDTFKEFLRYEYSVYFNEEGITLNSENTIDIDERALYKGEARYWLSGDYYTYILSDDFVRDMNVFNTWITEKRWNDLNSTIVRDGWSVSVYTFNPENDFPIMNDIDKVTPLDSAPDTYITATGNYVFDYPYAGQIETFENSDGSLDIVFTGDGGKRQGVRVYLSGSVTEIDRSRRVIPQPAVMP